MPTYEEARSIVLENVAPLGTERVETGRALGRTLAEDVSAPWPLPFCDNSAMDGYAVRADECRGPARLRITGYIPGNPVSALITFEVFVRPALLRMMGRKRVLRPLVKATLAGEVRKKPGKVHFLRVGIEVKGGEYIASSAGDQNTGILRTMVLADAIAVLPADKTVFAAGERVDIFLLGETLR